MRSASSVASRSCVVPIVQSTAERVRTPVNETKSETIRWAARDRRHCQNHANIGIDDRPRDAAQGEHDDEQKTHAPVGSSHWRALLPQSVAAPPCRAAWLDLTAYEAVVKYGSDRPTSRGDL